MAFIKFSVKNVQVNEANRIIKAKVANNIFTNLDGKKVNELALIQAALSQMTSVVRNNSFTYTFPIQL